jgi:hypothetical protein
MEMNETSVTLGATEVRKRGTSAEKFAFQGIVLFVTRNQIN